MPIAALRLEDRMGSSFRWSDSEGAGAHPPILRPSSRLNHSATNVPIAPDSR
jgi:hypothetical protein